MGKTALGYIKKINGPLSFTLDESPMAYKDKDVIVEAIKDTAIILDTIKPILNVKAG